MAEPGAVYFTITHEGNRKGKPSKSFTLRSGTDSVVRIGRAPGNDIVIEHRGASQYHAELRLRPDDSGSHRLHVKDISMNGTGMKTVNDKTAVHLRKSVDEPVPDGSTLLVPMLLKAALTENDRTWLKVTFQDTPPAEPEGRTQRARKEATPAAAPQPTPAPSQPTAAARDGSASDQDEDKDAEKSRMQFVELLLKTREVTAGTTYDEARRLLSGEAVWGAVDETTRRECFDIFVEHLGNHNSKKGKKKDKDKGKSKKEKRRHEEEAAPQKDAPPEASRGKRRKDTEKRGGSGSPERHRKSKREKKGRDRSRGRSAGGNCSRSPSRQKKRRRGRSGSA
mmetsp:Transcript_64025/g.198220  ORF Transcript_64025/g.198220 Transcript_64025/m.198220 type:complete len:338 (+) Transcript_64025:82-1095(+)